MAVFEMGFGREATAAVASDWVHTAPQAHVSAIFSSLEVFSSPYNLCLLIGSIAGAHRSGRACREVSCLGGIYLVGP